MAGNDHSCQASDGVCECVCSQSEVGVAGVLGGPPAFVATFELDGVDYTFHDGLPFPTGTDGAPDGLEIVAMAPAVLGERDLWNGTVPLNASELEGGDVIRLDTGERIARQPYGSGMVACFTRGYGMVFNTGSTEWVNGLITADPFVEQITRNVLDRCFAGPTRGPAASR